MGNPYAPRKKSNAKESVAPKKDENKSLETPTEPQKTENTPEPVKPANEASEPKLVVPETTMEGILDWVGEDKERAAAAIEHEKAQPKPRKTLLSKLGDI